MAASVGATISPSGQRASRAAARRPRRAGARPGRAPHGVVRPAPRSPPPNSGAAGRAWLAAGRPAPAPMAMGTRWVFSNISSSSSSRSVVPRLRLMMNASPSTSRTSRTTAAALIRLKNWSRALGRRGRLQLLLRGGRGRRVERHARHRDRVAARGVDTRRRTDGLLQAGQVGALDRRVDHDSNRLLDDRTGRRLALLGDLPVRAVCGLGRLDVVVAAARCRSWRCRSVRRCCPGRERPSTTCRSRCRRSRWSC